MAHGPVLALPGPKSLLTLFGAEHGLGGVAGYDVAETTDEDPGRVAAVQRLTWAYLRSTLYPGTPPGRWHGTHWTPGRIRWAGSSPSRPCTLGREAGNARW